MGRLRRADHGLALALQQRDEQLAVRGVELAHHVIEEHQRGRASGLEQGGALGEQEGEEGEPLLSLGGEPPQLPAAETELDLVELRPV